MNKKDVFVMSNGDVLELSGKSARINGHVNSGAVYVDGLGVGDVGNVVLRDRKHLSEDGLIVVICAYERETGEMLSGPEIISRGFVYVKKSEDLMDGARDTVRHMLDKMPRNGKFKGNDYNAAKNEIRDTLREFVWQKTKRRPMILPVIMEI